MTSAVTRGPARIAVEELPWLIAILVAVLLAGAIRLYRRQP